MKPATIAAMTLIAISANISTNAEAQDILRPEFNWSGGYFGVQAGAGWSKVTQPFFFAGFPELHSQANADGTGVLGGIHAGYNWHSGSIVFGAEADVEASSIDGDDGGDAGRTNGFNVRWTGSLRARAGISFDRTLLYGTAGFAALQARVYQADSFAPSSTSATFSGWSLGAGIEHALTDNITVRSEYRYADFGARTVYLPIGYYEVVKPDLQTVRLGLSYKF